jgi:hypothetical protein
MQIARIRLVVDSRIESEALQIENHLHLTAAAKRKQQPNQRLRETVSSRQEGPLYSEHTVERIHKVNRVA